MKHLLASSSIWGVFSGEVSMMLGPLALAPAMVGEAGLCWRKKRSGDKRTPASLVWSGGLARNSTYKVHFGRDPWDTQSGPQKSGLSYFRGLVVSDAHETGSRKANCIQCLQWSVTQNVSIGHREVSSFFKGPSMEVQFSWNTTRKIQEQESR